MQKTLYIPIDTTLNYEFECPLLVKKYDTLKFKFAIFSLGILQDLNGQTVDLILYKKDGTTIQKTITNTTLNIATIILDKNASACIGEVLGEIVITDAGGQVTSNIFKFNVSNSLTEDIEIKSKDDITTIEDMRALIATYKNEISAIGESTQAVEALNNITTYIDTNLSELTSKNAAAVKNVTDLKKENDRADTNIPGLTNLNDTAEEKLQEFREFDTSNIVTTLRDHGSQLNETTQSLENAKTDISTNYARKTDVNELDNNKAEKITVQALDTKVNQLASGSPKSVNSISEMTDTTKNYVLTTDGNWYYYNGSTWIIGGLYQSTGIADKSVTNSKINDINIIKSHINEVLECSLFHKQYAQTYGYDIFTGKFNFTSLSTDHSGMFLKIDGTKINDYVYLVIKGLKFTGSSVPVYAWDPSSSSDFELFKNISQDGVYKLPKVLFTNNREILINVLKGTTVTCENLWVSYSEPEYTNPSFFEIFNQEKTNISNKIEGSCKSNNLFDKKTVITESYINWQNGKVQALTGYSASNFIEINPTLPYRYHDKKGFVGEQMAFYTEDKAYISGINYPCGFYDSEHDVIPQNAKFVRFTIRNNSEDVMFYQSDSHDIPIYNNYGLLLDYYSILNKPQSLKIFYVKKDGTGDYTKLKDAVEEAIKYNCSTIYVGDGSYNLIDEFGATFFENFQLGQAIQGIMLCNDVHIIFSPLSEVVCHYTGTNLNVEQDFSPFTVKIGCGGFTIENLNLKCSRVRYPIHDEHYGDNVSYINTYRNCNIYFDSTTKTKNNYPQCIGGGLSKSGNILIENCIFESAGLTSKTGIVSYHNSYSHDSGARSEIVIKDSYFAGEYATARASYLGKQTDVSICKVINCSLGIAPYVEAEKDATVVNMKMYAFNNEIR